MQILSFLFFLMTLMVGITVLIAELRMGADRIVAALAGKSVPLRSLHYSKRALAIENSSVSLIKPRAIPRPVVQLPLAA